MGMIITLTGDPLRVTDIYNRVILKYWYNLCGTIFV